MLSSSRSLFVVSAAAQSTSAAHHHRHRRKRRRRLLRPRLPASAASRLPSAARPTSPDAASSLPSPPANTSSASKKKASTRSINPASKSGPAPTIEVSISHQQEVREVVDVHESPPAIDPAQVAAQETISGLDVINIVYPGTHDYRNALNFIPGVVQDQAGQPHVAGAQTYQTVTLLDGFNVTQPANGQLLVRVSTDAFRSIQVEPSREPAEDGKGSGGMLNLNTGIGDDHFRFFATNFIPSVQNKHGWRFDQFLPRFTFSGPIEKGKIWFYNAFDGEYDNTIYTELPVGADNDHTLRIGNLTKLQTNLTSRNILTASFPLNHLHDQYAFLSPQSPQLSNPKDVESAYFASLKDQHYFAGGQLLETGFAFDQYNAQLTPYGSLPYFINPNTAGGNFYLADQTHARRWQALSNLFLPRTSGTAVTISKSESISTAFPTTPTFARQPISFLSGANTQPSTSPDLCLTAPQDANFPCTRYSTFGPAPAARAIQHRSQRLRRRSLEHHQPPAHRTRHPLRLGRNRPPRRHLSPPRRNLRPRQLRQHQNLRRHRPRLRRHSHLPHRPPLRRHAPRHLLLRRSQLHRHHRMRHHHRPRPHHLHRQPTARSRSRASSTGASASKRNSPPPST